MNRDQAFAGLITAAGWRKSSYSQGQNGCVEVTTELPGWVGVRGQQTRHRQPAAGLQPFPVARDAGRRANR